MLYFQNVIFILIFGDTFGSLLIKKSAENLPVSSYVKQLVLELGAKDSNTHDVAIFHFHTFENAKQKVRDLYDDISKEIPDNVAVHISPLDRIVEDRNLRAASLSIIISDSLDFGILGKRFANIILSEYYDNSQKFIFVCVDWKLRDSKGIVDFSGKLKMLNFIVVGTTSVSFQVFSYNPFFREIKELDKSREKLESLFPDKLLNLNGYQLKTFLYDSPPRVQVQHGYFVAPEWTFLKIVAAKQNATISVHVYKATPSVATFRKFLFGGGSDVCLNTDIVSKRELKSRFWQSVDTFDTNGFCALVPYPKRNSIFNFLFTPFDSWTWIFMFSTMITCGFIWHLLRRASLNNSNSSLYFMFGFIANFLGQSIPFRNHHQMQKLILQLTILVTFILGTGYQSLTISSLFDSRFGTKIKTIEELISGNYLIHSNDMFQVHLNGSEYFEQLKPKIVGKFNPKADFKKLALENFSIIAGFSQLDYILKHDLNAVDFYYMLDAKFNTFYLQFATSQQSFYLKRLQEFSLRIFESGIRQQWIGENPKEDAQARKTRLYYENEEYYFNLIDLSPAFYLLGFGLALATVTFLFEIFWQDFLRHIKWKSILRILCRHRLRVEQKPEVRRTSNVPIKAKFIKVRPINALEKEV